MKSKFHSGELEVQARAGVLDTARRVAGVMRSTIPPVAQEFLKHQQMVVLSTKRPGMGIGIDRGAGISTGIG